MKILQLVQAQLEFEYKKEPINQDRVDLLKNLLKRIQETMLESRTTAYIDNVVDVAMFDITDQALRNFDGVEKSDHEKIREIIRAAVISVWTDTNQLELKL